MIIPSHNNDGGRQSGSILIFRIETEELAQVGANQIRVKFLASTVNPSDLNMIAGTYPGAVAPGVAGNEGVGVVEEVGNAVKNLKKGDRVFPGKYGLGMHVDRYQNLTHRYLAYARCV